jgi:2-isopropylmalate synthase
MREIMIDKDLIYDWNQKYPQKFPSVELCDETLRDGIQSPSVRDPHISDKRELLELMNNLHITVANIGLPGAGPRAYNDVLALANYAQKQRLNIEVICAARTLRADIEPIARIQELSGRPISAYCFLGTSPIRQMVEDWSIERLKKTTDEALSFALKENLDVAFVTEDTTRSSPEVLKELFSHALNLGVKRLVLCDTVGHATPDGIAALIAFTQELIKQSGQRVFIDWHGHNDRGLALSNALWAAYHGCDRIHGTAFGIGERVGNTSLDQLLVNLKLLGGFDHDLSNLSIYLEKAAQACALELPANYPVFGHDAFRTATGVHAAAVIKALARNNKVLANIIYSGVPAHWFGKNQIIDIGPMSGASNVRYWLAKNNIDASESLVKALLNFAKSQDQVLSCEQIREFVKTHCQA